MMDKDISWQNVADGYELHIAKLKSNMLEEPEQGLYWNRELRIALDKRKEAVEMAERERYETAIL